MATLHVAQTCTSKATVWRGTPFHHSSQNRPFILTRPDNAGVCPSAWDGCPPVSLPMNEGVGHSSGKHGKSPCSADESAPLVKKEVAYKEVFS